MTNEQIAERFGQLADLLEFQGANAFRIICLLMIQLYWPSALEFNHDYTFTVFVYSIIFALWYLYAMQPGVMNWRRSTGKP